MDETRRHEYRVGLITLIALALFILGITWGRGVRIGGQGEQLRIRFPAVAGLEPGAPVFVAGVRRGSVVALKPETASVLVIIELDRDVALRRDATARISLQELTGGRKVDIFPGTAPEPLPAGTDIPGTTTPDIAELLVNFGEAANEVRQLASRLDTVAGALTAVLSLPTRQALQQSIEDLRVVSQRLREFAERHSAALGQTAENAAVLSAELRQFVSTQRPVMDSIFQQLRQTSVAAGQTLGRIDSLVTELRRATEALLPLVQKLQSGKSLAARLLTEEALARQVDSTIVLLREFVEQIRQYGINVNVRLGTRP